jgi:hypothetical protein
MRVRNLAGVAALVVFATLFVLPAAALAQEATVTVSGEAGGYDVDFTLPTAAKSGCLVCHGDENLIRLREDEIVSFYVDPAQLEAGPHATVQCSGCHLDFAFTLPHVQEAEEWQTRPSPPARTATRTSTSSTVRACIGPMWATARRQMQPRSRSAVTATVRTTSWRLSTAPKDSGPCGITPTKICGRCHEDYWGTYSDYYHGRGFKAGAHDAPSCWDCHGYHDIRPSDDRLSMVHESRLAETCTGGDACHDDVNDGYLDYAELIHGQREVYEQNPLFAFFNRIRSAITGLFSG